MKSTGVGVGHAGVWVGHAEVEGVQNLSFEYKNNNYYYFIITIVLYSQLYQKIITRCSLYKNLDGMIIMLVPTEKSRKVACVLNGTEMLSLKATTNKNMPSLPHYPESS